MIQLSFWDEEEVKKDDQSEDTLIECHKCHIKQPVENFQVVIGKKNGYEIKRMCKSCKKGHGLVLEELRKANKYPDDDYRCPICEKNMAEVSKYKQKRLSQWVLDHCHETNTFRGWLCGNCNTGIGRFNDDVEKVSKALLYLQKHKEKLETK